MDRSIQSLLGITDDAKRIYRFVEGDVQKEEYEYCQLLDALVFGDKGYVETLGQTWAMIHDPRFSRIESEFIVNRKAVFGGDARTGKQYMSADGMFVSTIADLEEYSEVLGEGRYFWLVLTHPEERCPVRLWYERIYPDMLVDKGETAPAASDDLKCICDVEAGGPREGMALYYHNPRSLKDAGDDYLWALIGRECPNYFDKAGKPNGMAKRLFGLFRADLLGLIADYSPTPLVDAFIEIETGDVVHENEYTKNPQELVPRVFLEVDILEKALTYRATMRATAAKVLRSIGFQSNLKKLAGGDPRLTDFERDTLLRMVYQSDWPEDKPALVARLIGYLSSVTKEPYEERLEEQLGDASFDALDRCKMLRHGEIQPINSYTEPRVDVQLDQHAAVMEAILRNPLKQELFVLWVDAERLGEEGKTDIQRLGMRKLYSVLTPVFTDPVFEVDDEKFWGYMQAAKELGYYGQVGPAAEMEGEFVPDEGAFYRNRKLREKRGEKRTPLPPEESEKKDLEVRTVDGILDPEVCSPPHSVVPAADTHREGCQCCDCNPKFGPGG